jgi:hypothetical protein
VISTLLLPNPHWLCLKRGLMLLAGAAAQQALAERGLSCGPISMTRGELVALKEAGVDVDTLQREMRVQLGEHAGWCMSAWRCCC